MYYQVISSSDPRVAVFNRMIVEYKVPVFGSASADCHFEAILMADGSVIFQYQDMPEDGTQPSSSLGCWPRFACSRASLLLSALLCRFRSLLLVCFALSLFHSLATRHVRFLCISQVAGRQSRSGSKTAPGVPVCRLATARFRQRSLRIASLQAATRQSESWIQAVTASAVQPTWTPSRRLRVGSVADMLATG